MSENVNLADKSKLALWQSYCDKKMECESLVEELERLRGERDELVDMLERIQIQYVCGDADFNEINNLLAKIKGEDNE